jgi:hypothetical protein
MRSLLAFMPEKLTRPCGRRMRRWKHRCTNAPTLRPILEHVPHASHGVDQLEVERVIHLRAKSFDRDIDDVGIAVEIHVPDLRRDEGAREHIALALGKQLQQRKFLRGQVDSAIRMTLLIR